MRGVPFVQVPTTLLAMIDASVGGKTGVDTAAGKNLVGAFHQPAAVIADTERSRNAAARASARRTRRSDQARRDRRRSVLRLGRRRWPSVWTPLTLPATRCSTSSRAASRSRRTSCVATSAKHGVRKTLNFGHTLGHAIELCSGFALLHGEAVAIGMVYEARSPNDSESPRRERRRAFAQAIVSAGLRDALPASITPDEVVIATRGDKKARAGQAEYALPAAIGAMNEAHGRWSIPVNDDDGSRGFGVATARRFASVRVRPQRGLETMSSFATYLVGFLILIGGLGFAAYLLNVPAMWIGVGVVDPDRDRRTERDEPHENARSGDSRRRRRVRRARRTRSSGGSICFRDEARPGVTTRR